MKHRNNVQMRRYMTRYTTALFLLLSSLTTGVAQPFTVEGTLQAPSDGTGHLLVEVRADASDDFSATIFISAESPTLSSDMIRISPTMISAPYSDVSTIEIEFPEPSAPRTHTLVVTGKNGPAVAHDTINLIFPDQSAWKWLRQEDAVAAGIGEYSDAVVDHRKGIAYVISPTHIGVWDGTTARLLSTIPIASEETRYPSVLSTTLDSLGGLWVLKHRSVRRYDTETGEWRSFEGADPTTGLSAEDYEGLVSPGNRRSDRMQTSREGKVWLISSAGLFRFDPEESLWTSYHKEEWEFDISLWGSNCPRFTLDPDGNVWVSQEDGLVKFDGTFTYTYEWKELLGLTELRGPVTYLEIFGFDREKGVLVRSDANYSVQGVWSIHDATGRVERYVPYNEPEIAIQFPVDTFHFDSPIGFHPNMLRRTSLPSEEIWLALDPVTIDEYRFRYKVSTVGGLMREHDGKWYHYTSNNSGLPADKVKEVTVDDRNQVWILTSEGLVLLDGNLHPEELLNTRSSVSAPQLKLTATERRLEFFPNPTADGSAALCQLPVGLYSLEIYSVAGHRVAGFSNIRVTGENEVPVPTEILTPGTYIVVLADERGHRASGMLMKE